MSRTVRVLVLCNGNVGRSPLAAAMLANALAAEMQVPVPELSSFGIEVVSAGIEAPEGHTASRRGQAYAAPLGLDLSRHSATLVTAKMIERADIIYAMDRDQIDGVARLRPGADGKVSLWAGEGKEIPDPHHESDEFFVEVGDRIAAALPERVKEILGFRPTDKG
jgi:protein-tyrosine phosphatase